MSEDHEMREECIRNAQEFRDHKDDMTNPKDGVIRCIYKHIGDRVRMRTFLSLIGVLIFITGASIKFTYSQSQSNAEAHELHATKVEMKENDAELKEYVEKVERKVDKLDEKLDDVKDEIIKAIINNR